MPNDTPAVATPAAPQVATPLTLASDWRDILASAKPVPSADELAPAAEMPVVTEPFVAKPAETIADPAKTDEPPPTTEGTPPETVVTAPATDESADDVPEVKEREIDAKALIDSLKADLDREAQSNQQLQSLKGRQGAENKALKDELVAMKATMQEAIDAMKAGKTPAADSADVLAELFENPDAVIAKRVDAILKAKDAEQAKLAEQSAAEQAQQNAEAQGQFTTLAAWKLFEARFADSIGPDRDAWSQSDEAKSLLTALQDTKTAEGRRNAAALKGFALDNDYEGIADLLGTIHKRSLNGKRGAALAAKRAAETKRIEAGKSGAGVLAAAPIFTQPTNGKVTTWKDDIAALRADGL